MGTLLYKLTLPFTNMIGLSVSRLPLISFITMDICTLVGNHQFEIAFLQYPLAIITYECKIIGIQIEGDSLCFARQKLYFIESTEASTIRNHAGNKVAAEQKNALFARNLTRILHIHAHLDDVAVAEIRLGNLQVAILIRGVAQTMSEAPLLSNLRIVVVSTFHRTHLLTLLEIVVGERIDFLRIGVRHLATEV